MPLTLKKGTRLYHVANAEIGYLKDVRTYFASSPIGAVFMAPTSRGLTGTESYGVNLRKRLYVLTLSEDTIFEYNNTTGSNFVGDYSAKNAAARHLVEYGYDLQEFVIDRPDKHKWEKATDITGKMPSVQLFLAKYPIWTWDAAFLPLQGTDPYSFFEDDWKTLESNFKMKELVTLDEAQLATIQNKWTRVLSQPIIDFVSTRMAFKTELGDWADFVKRRTIAVYKRNDKNAPSYLRLDALPASVILFLPNYYTVVEKYTESEEVLALKEKLKGLKRQRDNAQKRREELEEKGEEMWDSLSPTEQEEQDRRESDAEEEVQDLQRKIGVVHKKIRKAKDLKVYCDEQRTLKF
jgi:hypothetical protein